MFLFDWRRIHKEANGNAVEIVRIVRMLVLGQIPTNAVDPIYKYSNKTKMYTYIHMLKIVT